MKGISAERILLLFEIFCLIFIVKAQQISEESKILTPTYFNVAQGKDIYATRTCGMDEGSDIPSPGELYCKLTGNTGNAIRPGEQDIIQGQYCDYCDVSSPARAHPIKNAIDGTEKWWQSPPLSRGMDFSMVNVTLNLGQLYHVAYIIIKVANSPRPGRWILERSRDYGETYKPWQYFAESASVCNDIYGMESLSEIRKDDDVICTAEYSGVVPLEDGEIVISLVNDRPGATNFSYSSTLQEWTKATNIRLSLIKTNTLLGHLMGLARQDPTVTRRYYYSIKDISVGGRCVCNGHAEFCDTPGPNDRLQCTCEHNTCGAECEVCCPGFVQKKWRPATLDGSNECEVCNCHNHSMQCYYDEEIAKQRLSLDIYGKYVGGGVCTDCQHNTQGINCHECIRGYFQQGDVPLDSPDICQPCNCNLNFSSGNCAPITGQCECKPEFAGSNCSECNIGYYGYPNCKPCQCNVNGTRDQVCKRRGGDCPCKPNYTGRNCDKCEQGYYNFPECRPCECNDYGSFSRVCSRPSGQCQCRDTYAGRACGECEIGYYNFPYCQACVCDVVGVTDDYCNETSGSCLCKENFQGKFCDRCRDGFFNYSMCEECGCDPLGSMSLTCNDIGECTCREGFSGSKCDVCEAGYYRYPECLDCNCHLDGSSSILCNDTNGQCSCNTGFQGGMCDQCAQGFYNFPNCEECNCDPAGVIETPGQPLGGCGQATGGACLCKENVIGRTCDTCAPLFFNLQRGNPLGCEGCDCITDGTVGGLSICDMDSGQCLCKSAVKGRQCGECSDGYYRLEKANTFGCIDCGCDVGGSVNGVCNKQTGQCICRPRVTGKTCNKPAQLHFYPSLHQIKFEIESGSTPQGFRPRIGFEENIFPGFSYLGYAVMSNIQPVVLVTISVDRPRLYRIIFRYVFNGDSAVKGHVTIIPSTSALGVEQESNILFIPGQDPQFVTIEGGGIIKPFVMNQGEWTIRIEAPDGVLLDYLVLLPEEFYEATILLQSVADPCIPGVVQDRCNYYVYPDVDVFPSVRGVEGYYYDVNTNQHENIREFGDEYLREELEVTNLAFLDENQSNLGVALPFDKLGDYYFIIEYYGGGPGTQTGTFDVYGPTETTRGFVNFQDCSYLCRSIVVDASGEVMVFNIEEYLQSIQFTQTGQPYFLAVSAIYAIPVGKFSYDLIVPSLECVRNSEGDCLGSIYSQPPGSVMIDIADLSGEYDPPPNIYNPSTTLQYFSRENGVTEVRIDENIPSPGRYVFVVHYYQPNSVSFDVNFKILGEINGEGSFKAEYCPHISGCRSIVMTPEGGIEFEITPSGQAIQTLLPDGSEGSLWIDYILAIPADSYDPTMLFEIPQDRAAEFILYCGNNEFYITTDSSDLCKNAVFSISSQFNNGALPCNCNPQGSLSFSCEEIAGQCPCKAHIVGRECDRCMIGHYDYPLCRACSCPNSVCNEVTGECICPSNVVGRRCDRCADNTYGYHPLSGCVDCECDERGVVDSDLSCDEDSGQCRCKPNVAGRRCDQCLPGFYQYPFCQRCDCDLSGTREEICDQTTSQCLCKDNVVGDRCDQCAAGTFFLDGENPTGCISCFCFDVTDDCKSYTRNRHKLGFTEEWTVVNMKDTENRIRYRDELVNLYVNGHGDDPNAAIYWVPPANFLGNKLNSYGGYLEFTVSNNPLLPRGDTGMEPQQIRRADVILAGNGISIVYLNIEQPQPNTAMTVRIKITESNFQYSFSSSEITRQDFMMVLANIDLFQIRAQYFDNIVDASLSDVSFDITRKDGAGEVARSVERCRCPPEYAGLSCEQCAPGHYRIQRGTFLGQCVRCDCNGHSNTCDVNTGQCLDCQDNTAGDHCELCKTGYHGNATLGTTTDCQMCACPEATEGLNFAETCIVTPSNELFCVCLPGHTGQYCDICVDGFFGNTSVPGGGCRRCQCYDNSDPGRPGPECDPLHGGCLRCRPDTTGDSCQDCADGYFGDAQNAKDCRPCDCDGYGTESCSKSTGECYCQPNVIGDRCDQCRPYYFNFGSGRGCEPCVCDIASISYQCHETGQCACQPGVGGDKCDVCLEGFYNYTRYGCTACTCGDKLRCDPEDGSCICPPGATGEMCDQCEERYVLTDDGCLPCDDCVNLLLDALDDLYVNTGTIGSGIFNVSVGFDTINRTEHFNKSIQALQPPIEVLELNGLDMDDVLSNMAGSLDELKALARKTEKQRDKAYDRSLLVGNKTDGTLERAKTIDAKIGATFQGVIDAANRTGPRTNATGDFGDLLDQARKIVEEIRGRNFSDAKGITEEDKAKAVDLLARVKALKNNSNDIMDRLLGVRDDLISFTEKIDELVNRTAESDAHIDSAEEAFAKNVSAEVDDNMSKAGDLYTMAEGDNGDAQALLDEAAEFIDDAKAALQVTAANASTVVAAIRKLNDRLPELRSALNNTEGIVNNATEYADDLADRAEYLANLLVSTKELAENALNAANAYNDIVEAIELAEQAALAAKNASSLAEQEANGFGDRPAESLRNSNKKLKKAEKAGEGVTDLGDDLTAGVVAVDEATGKLDQIALDLSEIERGMMAIPSADSECTITVCAPGASDCKQGFSGDNCNVAELSQQAGAAKMQAMDASTRANAAKDSIVNIEAELPGLTEQATLTIPDDITVSNDATEEAQEQIDAGRAAVNGFRDLEQSLLDKHSFFVNKSAGIIGDLTELRKRIDQARTLAQGIRVAAKFERNTTLRLRKPEEPEGGIHTSLSLFFKTREEDATIFFAGGTKADDNYVALEVQEGELVFKFNLGDGDVNVVTAGQNVANGMWHQVIAERSGRFGTLKVFTTGAEGGGSVYTAKSDNAFTLLELSEDMGVFIGPVVGNFVVPANVGNNPFVGGIDEILFNQQPLGIWNFATAENFYQGVLRNITDLSKTVDPADEGGILFNGNGYVKYAKGDDLSFARTMALSLSFKGQATDGLLFFAGAKGDYISLELKKGRVIMAISVGGTKASLGTKKQYNNGKWTSVDVTRTRTNLELSVQQEMVEVMSEAYAPDSRMKQGNFIYFGGLVGIKDNKYPSVTRKGFLGCLKDITIIRSNIDLLNNVESKGIFPNCIKQNTELVSFSAGGFIDLPPTDFYGVGDLIVRFRSFFDSGLIFYTANVAQDNVLALHLDNGVLEAVFVSGNSKTVLRTTQSMYNDGEWHTINIRKRNNREVEIRVNDVDVQSGEFVITSVVKTDGVLYVGGVPPGTDINNNAIAEVTPFIGCLSDLSIGYNFKNFADRLGDFGANYDLCPENFTASSVAPQLRETTTAAPQSTQEAGAQCAFDPMPVFTMDPADQGARFFGATDESRLEYQGFGKDYSRDAIVTFEIKTAAENGVIFYTADSRQIDFSAMSLRDGKLVFGFCYGSEELEIESPEKINDLQWHKVAAIRAGFDGYLDIDDVEVASDFLGGTSRFLTVDTPLYVGGLPPAADLTVNDIDERTRISLVGCIKNFLLDDEEPPIESEFEVTSCPGSVEPGVFFRPGGGYLIVENTFRVGTDMDISFSIKPRSQDGTIFSVQMPGGDFMSLELMAGSLHLTIQNGVGPFSAVFEPAGGMFSLCDGEWHSVLVRKAGFTAAITVDGIEGPTATGIAGARAADTDNPLYFGGLPINEIHDGIINNNPYLGCMKDLVIRSVAKTFSSMVSNGNVDLRSCPAY